MLSASTGNYYAGQIKVATFVRPNISTSTWPPQLVLRSLCYAARYGSKKTSIQASSGKLLSAPRGLSDVKVRKKPPKQKEMEETQEMAANIQYISGESDVIQEHRFKNWIVIYCSRSTLLFYTYFINDTGFYTFSGFFVCVFCVFLKKDFSPCSLPLIPNTHHGFSYRIVFIFFPLLNSSHKQDITDKK